MKLIVDFHIHSKYSRAVSPGMTLENIDLWAGKKGVRIAGTGDFTHPAWFNEIKTKLQPAEEGLFKLKSQISRQRRENLKTRFMLTAEIACIYSKGGKTRRVHHVIHAPSLEAAEKINNKLGWIGNLKADGRPMLGLDSRKLLEIILEADSRCVLVPAHAWTPWFSVFGSMSGFDSVGECFDDYSKYIFVIETGLSSDPKMNWRLSALDKIALVSNSDAHSPGRIGREANVFNCEPSYDGIFSAIREVGLQSSALKSDFKNKFLYTIEFFPEEGKYHFDGHRDCGISFSPSETKKHKGLCPKCGRKLTAGVLSRVEELADRSPSEDGLQDPKSVFGKRIPYKNLISLEEIIAEAKGVGVQSKTVRADYEKLLAQLGLELSILIDVPLEKISDAGGAKIAEGVKRVREGKIKIKPGYDGEYGKIKIFEDNEKIEKEPKQNSLF